MLISVLLPVFVFFIFPLDDWGQLWNRKVMNLPFVIFLLSIVLGLGLLYGILSGMFWNRCLKEIDDQLYLLEQGRAPMQSSACSIQEFAEYS